MESKFPQRVDLERRALRLVNGRLQGAAELVGLSDATVTKWISDLSQSMDFNSARLGELAAAVRLVAEAARSEADISDEIFVDIDAAEAASAMARLERALDSLLSGS